MFNSKNLLLLGIILLAIGVRVINLNQSFWLDEAAQVIESARPLSQQLDIKADFWPPLYHILLYFWMRVSHSEVWIRLLSVQLGVATVIVTYFFSREMLVTPASFSLRKRGGSKLWRFRKSREQTALLVTLFLTIAPFHIWYSQEARPYALSAFLGLLSTYYLIKWKFRWYVVGCILFVYSTYLAPFLLFAHGIFIWAFNKGKFLEWVKAIILTSLVFAPWIPALIDQFMIGTGLTQTLPGWSEAVSTPLVKSLPLIFAKFIGGRITFVNKMLYGGIVGILFGLFVTLVWLGFTKMKSVVTRLLVLLLVPIAFAFMVSMFVPILAPQRVIFLLPFFYLLIAVGSFYLPKLQYVALSIVMGISLFSLYLYNTDARFQREKWREAVRFVESTSKVNSGAVFVFPDAFAPWQWYSDGTVPSLAVAPNFRAKSHDLENYVEIMARQNRLYYFHYLTDLTDPKNLVPQLIHNLGFKRVSTHDFSGVGFITIYEKNIAFY